MVTICNQIHKNTDKFSYRGIKGRSKNSKINSICNLWTRIYGYFLYFLQERTSVRCTILKADIAVCWTAEHIYALAMLILCGLYLRSGRWKNHKI